VPQSVGSYDAWWSNAWAVRAWCNSNERINIYPRKMPSPLFEPSAGWLDVLSTPSAAMATAMLYVCRSESRRRTVNVRWTFVNFARNRMSPLRIQTPDGSVCRATVLQANTFFGLTTSHAWWAVPRRRRRTTQSSASRRAPGDCCYWRRSAHVATANGCCGATTCRLTHCDVTRSRTSG
jgi:hypothetical protein